MKNYIFSLILLLFIIGSSFNYVDAEDIYYNPSDISTRAYDVIYDKQRKLFIITADKKRYAVKIVFTKTGKIINFNNKIIQYKNGRFARIGNDYVSYLNGKLYKIGGKTVEIGEFGYVNKIGDLTPHQYFIGNDFTQEDAIKSNGRTAGMTFNVLADGTDFGGSFSDVLIYFDGVEVYDGSKKEEKKYTGIEEIKHNCSFNGTPLYGRVKVVEHFGKFKVKKVENFGDIRIRKTPYPNRCGQWNFVDSLEDFTIEYVDSLEDFRVEFVNSLEGI